MNKANGAYERQKRRASERQIEFTLTFDEWMEIWLASGHWADRGTRKGQYCMSRVNDTGPYAVGNVFIQLHATNAADGQRSRKHSTERTEARAAKLRGVPRPKKIAECPHCGVHMSENVIKRYHFDRCPQALGPQP